MMTLQFLLGLAFKTSSSLVTSDPVGVSQRSSNSFINRFVNRSLISHVVIILHKGRKPTKVGTYIHKALFKDVLVKHCGLNSYDLNFEKEASEFWMVII